jgi:hypothetical protein
MGGGGASFHRSFFDNNVLKAEAGVKADADVVAVGAEGC